MWELLARGLVAQQVKVALDGPAVAATVILIEIKTAKQAFSLS